MMFAWIRHWFLTVLTDPPSDPEELVGWRRARDATLTFLSFMTISAMGGTALFTYALQWKPAGFARVFGGGLLLSCASYLAGTCLGFLFGIPRTPKVDENVETPAYRVNTNLEEISDWLTKIIVGLGLIELRRIPEHARRLAQFVRPAVGGDADVALIIFVAYAVTGFMVGYILTRLFLAGAFIRADVSDGTAALRREVEKSSTVTKPTEQGKAAERVAELATSAGETAVRQQLEQLTREYERIRASEPFSASRTERLIAVANKIGSLSVACYGMLPHLTRSTSAGERLAAAIFLTHRPHRDYIGWLAQRFPAEEPFVQYHLASAVLAATRVFGKEKRQELEEAIRVGQESVNERDQETHAILDEAARTLAAA